MDQLNAGSGYAYDLKGALEYDPSAAGDPRLHFQYGSDDLLRRIDREGSSPQDESSMVWDADEQRLQLTEEVGYGRWQFVYDTAAGIPAVLVQRKADMDNETLGVTFHVREPGGELLASFESGGTARYYHFDALGSTVLLSDSSGNPAGAYAYGAWGDVLASPASWQPYQYVGQLGYYTHTTAQGSELADWLQLGVRFYQPEIGRFGQQGSPYTYAENRPTGVVQPSGGESKPPVKTPPAWKTIRAGLYYLGGCGVAVYGNVAQECGLAADCSCACRVMDDIEKGLVELSNGGLLDKLCNLVASPCFAAADSVVDDVCHCDKQKKDRR